MMYLVGWYIETEAETFEDAAKEALDCVISGDARVFEVMNIETQEQKQVDLSMIENTDEDLSNQLELDL